MISNKSKIRILLVGGASGGHFFPLISIAETLNTLETRPALYYAGPTQYDANALAKEQISFLSIPSGKQRRYLHTACKKDR